MKSTLRAIDTEAHRVGTVIDINYLTGELTYQSLKGHYHTDSSRSVLARDTELYDVNGEKIFEHDIVKVTNMRKDKHFYSTVIYDAPTFKLNIDLIPYDLIPYGYDEHWDPLRTYVIHYEDYVVEVVGNTILNYNIIEDWEAQLGRKVDKNG